MKLKREKQKKGFSFLTRDQEQKERKKELRQKARAAVEANRGKKDAAKNR